MATIITIALIYTEYKLPRGVKFYLLIWLVITKISAVKFCTSFSLNSN